MYMLNCNDMDKVFEIFGQRIYERRRLLKMKQIELAQKSDISTNYLRRIEYGTTNMTIRMLHSLCIALNLDYNELLNFSEPIANTTTRARMIKKLEKMPKEQREQYFELLENLIHHFRSKED